MFFFMHFSTSLIHECLKGNCLSCLVRSCFSIILFMFLAYDFSAWKQNYIWQLWLSRSRSRGGKIFCNKSIEKLVNKESSTKASLDDVSAWPLWIQFLSASTLVKLRRITPFMAHIARFHHHKLDLQKRGKKLTYHYDGLPIDLKKPEHHAFNFHYMEILIALSIEILSSYPKKKNSFVSKWSQGNYKNLNIFLIILLCHEIIVRT